MFTGCCKRLVKRPSFQSVVERILFYSYSLRPIHNAEIFAAKRYVTVAGSVPTLLKIRSPFAIAFAVISIIVSSLDGQIVWTQAHISQKVFKLHPALANLYASSAVMFKAFIFWIQAALFHGMPRRVFRRVFPILRTAMFSCPALFIIQAAATFRRAAF